MLKFLNLQPELFGIDINDSSLKIAKLSKKRKHFELVSFNEVPIAQGVIKEGVIQDPEALIKIITLACLSVQGKKLGTKYIVASLPEEKSFSQVIQMPKMRQEELGLAVPFEAENYIPLSIDKVYLDFQVIDNPKENSEHLDLLINVMPKSIVDLYVSCFQRAGLVPCVLEVESQAIARVLLKDGKSDISFIFIDLGQDSTSFIIFSGNSIRFTSSISISSSQLTRIISDNLKVTSRIAEELKIKYGLLEKQDKKYNIKKTLDPILDDLVLQIKKYINFYYGHVSHDYFSSNEKIGKIILSGGGANLRGLSEFLFKELDIVVEIGDPFINITASKIMNQQKALSFITALGLALRGANSTS